MATPDSNGTWRQISRGIRWAEENSGRTFAKRSSPPDEQWSGLSESNRHLNLGKVPYYHYTKAAQRPSFYSMTARQPQAFPALLSVRQTAPRSGDLGNARGLHHRRAPLALRETRGFILVRVHPPELFSVSIENTDEEMVMSAAPIFAEGSLASSPGFFRPIFCHVDHPISIECALLSQGSKRRTSTRDDSNPRSITAEKFANGNPYLRGEQTSDGRR